MRQQVVLVGMFGLLVTGCASDEPASDPRPTSNAALGGIDTLRHAVSRGDTASVAGAVLAAQAYSLTIPTPRVAPLPMELPQPGRSLSFTGNASCSASSCTFTNYGDSYNGVTFSLTGTVSLSADRLVFDMELDLTSPEGSIHWNLDADVFISTTRLDGWSRSHGTVESSEGTSSWDFDLDYNDIGLDSTGCPVSGSILITYAFSSTSSQEADSGAVSFTYGPACGNVEW